jgi:hypothetical protein
MSNLPVYILVVAVAGIVGLNFGISIGNESDVLNCEKLNGFVYHDKVYECKIKP